MTSLGVVVARGASKRIPRKVLQPLLGTPLLAWAAGAALAAGLDRVILSTDDNEIASCGTRCGLPVPFMRPAELATDTARNDEVLLHAVERMAQIDGRAYDVAVLIQPTVPFLLPRHVDDCVSGLARPGTAACFAAVRVSEPPDWMFTERDDGTVKLLLGGTLTGNRQHTQLLGVRWLPAGAVWATRTDTLRTTKSVYVEPLRIVAVEAERAIDIDEPLDMVIAEAIGRHYGFRPLNTQSAAALKERA